MVNLKNLLLLTALALPACQAPQTSQEERLTSLPQTKVVSTISDYRLPRSIFDAMHRSYSKPDNKCDDLAQQARDILVLKGVQTSALRLRLAWNKKDPATRHMWLEQLLVNNDTKIASWYIIDPSHGESFYYVPEGKHGGEYETEKVFSGDAIYIDEPLPPGTLITKETVGYMGRNQFKMNWLEMIASSK